jgi:PAS domain S-box-containing protein
MFRELFETAPDAMVVVDRTGTIVLCNPQANRLFGFDEGELVGQPIEALLPEGARDAHRGHRDRYMSAPRVRPMGAGQELTGRRRNGEAFPVEIALSPIETPEGKFYVASIRDVSETQRARQALARARYDTFVAQIGQLALESRDYASVLEAVPPLAADALGVDAVAIVFADAQRGEIQVRAATGLAPELARVAWAPVSGAPISQLLVSGKPFAIADLEAAGVRKANPLFAAGMRAAFGVPLFDLGQPMGALVALARVPREFDRDAVHFLQSIANLLAAAGQRYRTEDQLSHAQRLEAVGQLTGGIAHDFNNLLTVVSGNLQLLEDEVADKPDAREIIGAALRAVGRGADLTRKLLAFARRQRLAPRAVEPQKLVGELGVMLARTLGEAVAVEIDCPAQVPPVYADPTQLDAALVNLALNSRDAMPRGGRLTISVGTRHVPADAADTEQAPGDYVVFTVADTGHGMPPDVLARAFEPFFTTKGAGKGSGLGLSMVYGFVKQSGGRLAVDSELGYGTRIEIALPAVRPGAAPAAETAAAPSSRGHESVLVVEDEPDVRGVAVAFLRSLGYAVLAAGSAPEAIQILSSDAKIDLLFSDVILGSGMTGGELAHEARRLRPGLRVLLTSGYERTALDEAAAPDAAFELLRKPYRREELSAAVRRALEGR